MIANLFVTLLPWRKVRDLLRLMRVDRPIGTWLLLWPSLWSLAAASPPGELPWHLVAIFTLGAFITRSAGCVINDIADRHFDPQVARTKDRPLASGKVTLKEALLLLCVLLLLALGLALLLPPLALKMCFIGAFLTISYPFTKRFFHAPQLYMGVAFGWGVVIAWSSISTAITLPAWLIFTATLAWAAGYDTIYAMLDREDDLRIGIRSTAILFGEYDRLAVAILYGIALLLLFLAGTMVAKGWLYHCVLLICLGQMGWQLYAIRGYEQNSVLSTFLSNRWLGMLIFLGFWWG